MNRAVIKIKRTLQRALAKADIDNDASAIVPLARELLKVEERIAAEAAAAEASAITAAGNVTDDYLLHLDDDEHRRFLGLYTLAVERMQRGDLPRGGAIRRITTRPTVTDRIHTIERRIIDSSDIRD